MTKRIVFLILTILWMLIIFWFSSRSADDSTTQSFFITEKFFRLFINNPSHKFLEASETIIRKIAHFTEYFILGGLVFGTVKSFSSRNI